ncbi:MAG: hypothetical protein QY323_03735 [Patescibacteria group bacterium]|nr:MAG: hypothetical protein QY323_03735 [Patescibacteria group bacterium]
MLAGSIDLQTLEEQLKPFESSWKAEQEARAKLLFGPAAPLRAAQASYVGAIQDAKSQYKAALIDAQEKRDTAYVRADRERDAEYAAADAERDRAYAKADTARQSASSKPFDASAYQTHQTARSAAYTRHAQRRSSAYTRHASARSAAYTAHQHASTTAWHTKDQAERAAYAQREQVLKQYLATQPEMAPQPSDPSRKVDEAERFSYASAQALSIKALLDVASQVARGEKQVNTDEVAALAANLRDHLSSGLVDAHSPELVDEARRPLQKLIRRLN